MEEESKRIILFPEEDENIFIMYDDLIWRNIYCYE